MRDASYPLDHTGPHICVYIYIFIYLFMCIYIITYTLILIYIQTTSNHHQPTGLRLLQPLLKASPSAEPKAKPRPGAPGTALSRNGRDSWWTLDSDTLHFFLGNHNNRAKKSEVLLKPQGFFWSNLQSTKVSPILWCSRFFCKNPS